MRHSDLWWQPGYPFTWDLRLSAAIMYVPETTWVNESSNCKVLSRKNKKSAQSANGAKCITDVAHSARVVDANYTAVSKHQAVDLDIDTRTTSRPVCPLQRLVVNVRVWVCVYVCVFIFLCVYVCVCEREREGGGREGGREFVWSVLHICPRKTCMLLICDCSGGRAP